MMNRTIWRKAAVLLLVPVLLLSVLAYRSDNNFFEISKNLDIFATLFREVNTYYVDEIKPAELIKTGIDAMLESLDPYTNYITEADIESYRFQTTGKYGGIGALIRKVGDDVVIAEPYKGFPADKAGLRAGDRLVEVDGKSTKGKSVEDVSKILKGTPGTEVKVTIQRPNEKQPFVRTLVREEVKVSSVPYAGLVDGNIGYVRLTQFTENCSQEVASAIRKLQEKTPLSGLILDLRGNPGGLLHEAVNVSNLFIEKGQEIVSTRGKVKEWDKVYNTLQNALEPTLPLAVLINRSSASASEIVSGVMQDYDRGIILGQKTFGKGLVQTTRQLSYGTQLKVTTAHYYTPSGRCIQAINYAQRNPDGSVGKIPDSLKNAFKTRAGRIVYDGGGIDPDIVVEERELQPITVSLLSKNLIFDYATLFHQQHASIPPSAEFHLTDEQYNQFVLWLRDKEYDYTTKSEEKLREFRDMVKKEAYWDAISEHYTALEKEMSHDKEKDLIKFKDEIREFLEQEIALRYYYQDGRIEASLSSDPVVQKAKETLRDPAAYRKILQASN
ncbi:MAG: S41 family peptidase [Chitinophagales bacterium]|nr:S41 family peptidase [Chitinophagales bacterium]MDW8394167.1 S41 family peptidase [Chitinophagales bacterium]